GYFLYGSSDHHTFTKTFPANVTEYSPLALKSWTLYEIVVRPYYTSDGNAHPVYKVGKAAYVVYRSEAAGLSEPPDKATEYNKFRLGCRIPPFVALPGEAWNRCRRVFSEVRPPEAGIFCSSSSRSARVTSFPLSSVKAAGDLYLSPATGNHPLCVVPFLCRAFLSIALSDVDILRFMSCVLFLETSSNCRYEIALLIPLHVFTKRSFTIFTSSSLRRVFKSNGELRGKGFNVTHSTSCGGRVLASGFNEQRIYSHAKYGESYYSNRYDCEWLIQAKAGRVRLRFVAFGLESCTNCKCDYVKVFDGDSASGSLLGFFCGHSLPNVVTSTSSSLLIQFHTDQESTAKGFVLAFSVVE
ncbi:unnamed protein product, partial [Ixodes persulcatus]